ncbi:isoaspartyl dipeptidase [Kosmotoga arenicorallina S304]|uniref:Isoaspartyl dipeptidase n=1 Tax=Kosmotoga arenicorallina S304 TaxID=1453497 RepID=A0A182C7F6_9BACT|nr:amidohydrolase family protein [Kosmotoga arenicorallina]OAA31539.1 isoaspartyl dipeptidase [Kosmotoga arenicorallina S304]
MLLLRNLHIFSPENIGVNHVFICNEQICEISKSIIPGGIEYDTINFDPGKHFAVPGFIDGHVHLIGGGGEGGYITRTREGTPEEFLNCGTTAVLGLLGTDAITRDHISLLAKVRAFREEGISAWMLTGSYKYPIKTITGDHMKDLVLIPEVLGVGELAIADHRGSAVTASELKRLSLNIRVAGMISGKKGAIVCHMGNAPEGMAALFEATDDGTLPPTHLIPTHVSRNEKLLEEGIRWIKEKQGFIDLTANEKTAKVLSELKKELGNLDNVCVSTDGLGSLPVFDESGTLIELKSSPVDGLLKTFRELLRQGLNVEEALKPVCTTPAKALGIDRWGYGTLSKKSPASLLVFNAETLEIEVVVSSGKVKVNHL